MMTSNTCIKYIIYLLLDSYNNIYFFYSYKYFFVLKESLLTTTVCKPFLANHLQCSNLVIQVTTKLLQLVI